MQNSPYSWSPETIDFAGAAGWNLDTEGSGIVNLLYIPTTLRYLYFYGQNSLESFEALNLVHVTDGLYIYSNSALTTIALPELVLVEGYFELDACPLVTSLSLPKLVSVYDFYVYVSNVTTLSLPELTESPNEFSVTSCPSLTSVDLPKLTTCDAFYLSYNPALTTLNVPELVPNSWFYFSAYGSALSSESVNAVLARCVASLACVSGIMDFSGGTNQLPTGQGLIDMQTLIDRGVAVNINT
jgi:hypothetical protein